MKALLLLVLSVFCLHGFAKGEDKDTPHNKVDSGRPKKPAHEKRDKPGADKVFSHRPTTPLTKVTAPVYKAKNITADDWKYFDLAYVSARKRIQEKPRPYMGAPASQKISPMYQFPYANLIDFARLEHERPLKTDFLAKLMPEDVLSLEQEQFDQLYARLTAGYIPSGYFDGQANVLQGSAFVKISKMFITEKESKRFFKLAKKAGLNVSAETPGEMVALLANTLWKGKHFDNKANVLRNVVPVNDSAKAVLSAIVEGFSVGKSTSVTMQGKTFDAWHMFPARLYCGQSLIDSRRESVIIDYAYSDRIPGYIASSDFLASRDGIYIRDEIRMVRPGFYVGKAYIGRNFFLTFTLYNKEQDRGLTTNWKWVSDSQQCWNGTQEIAYLPK